MNIYRLFRSLGCVVLIGLSWAGADPTAGHGPDASKPTSCTINCPK